jgi:hypothetical protein
VLQCYLIIDTAEHCIGSVHCTLYSKKRCAVLSVPWKCWKGRLTVWDSCTGSPSCFVVAETTGVVETAWIAAAAAVVDGGGEAAVAAAVVVSS